jgi:hypothetical protein
MIKDVGALSRVIVVKDYCVFARDLQVTGGVTYIGLAENNGNRA